MQLIKIRAKVVRVTRGVDNEKLVLRRCLTFSGKAQSSRYAYERRHAGDRGHHQVMADCTIQCELADNTPADQNGGSQPNIPQPWREMTTGHQLNKEFEERFKR